MEHAVAQVNTNKGKDFWVAFITNYQLSQYNCYLIISSETSVSGTIYASDGWSENFNFVASGSVLVNIPAKYANDFSTGIHPNGIHIVASDSVYVTAYGGDNPDATMVLPTPSLGKEYIINTYADDLYLLNGQNISVWNEQFLVLAFEDETIVEIIPPDSIKFTVHLNKGEVYQKNKLVEFSSTSNKHLSGYRVKSLTCNKIAVFAGSPCSGLNNSTCDQLYEQMQPLYSLGKEFIVKGPLPILNNNYSGYLNHSFYSIVAVENNTTINLNGNIFILNAGETHRENVYEDFYLKADKPVSVANFSGGDGLPGDTIDDGVDPYMSMVSPADQEIYDIDFHYSSAIFYAGLPYITIIVKTINKANVYLEGRQIDPTSFVGFMNNTLYCYAQISLDKTKNRFHLHSSSGFNAYFFTARVNETMGYSLGFGYKFPLVELQPSFSIINSGIIVDYKNFNQIVCSCAPIIFSVNNPSSELLYKWKFDDTTFVYGETVSHHYLNGDHSITLYSFTKDSCYLNQATMNHLIVENCDILMTPPGAICEEDTIELSVTAGTTFLWSTGETTQSIKISPDITTLYTLSVDGGATTICDSIFVYVKGSRPVVNLGPSQTICEGASVHLNAAYLQATYLWQDNSTQSTFTATEEGAYFVTATNLCGIDQDTIDVFVITPPVFDLGNDAGICLQQQLQLCANVDADSYRWNTGSIDSCIIITQPGKYTVTASNRCFNRSDAITIYHVVCKELIFYNLITPNKDGLNEYFVVENIDERDCTLSVFNRWGNKVYEKDHYNNEWDASGLSDGVYYYRLDDHTTESVFKGWVQVLSNTSK